MKKYLAIACIFILVIVGGIYIHYNNLGHTMMDMSKDTYMNMDYENHAAMIKDDKSFLEHMIPHHEEAVISSKEILNITQDANVRTLAQGIVSAQEKEITEMKDWYEVWYGKPYKDTGMYKPMMHAVGNKNVKDAEQAYLQDMIMHHQSAIVMAHTVLPLSRHQEVKDLSYSIITTQKEEITTMQKLVKK